MAVKVKLVGGSRTITHTDGNVIVVRDGHLFIQSEPGNATGLTIATYAAGQWAHAAVDDPTESQDSLPRVGSIG